MYLDANATSFNQSTIDCDIAIVGAGPAGITLAEQFKSTPFNICVLESGGFEFDSEIQKLSNGTCSAPSPAVETDYISQHSQRLLGGTGSVWGGFCREMDDIDFEQRDLGFDHQWPISLADLRPFYTWHAREKKFDRQAINNTALEIRHFEKIIYPFNIIHKKTFEPDKNIQIILNASVVDIISHSNSTIAYLNVVNSGAVNGGGNKSFQVKAKAYVLACGGIGNARLLLNATGADKNGLGNKYDQVGRHFMEHPHFQFYNAPALLWLADRNAPWWYLDKTYKPAFFFNSEKMREEKQLNFCAMISPSFDEAPGFAGAKMYQPNFAPLSEKEGAFYSMAFRCEQRPNPDSRVTLTDDKDALGLRRVHLNWQLTDEDKQSFIRNIYLLAEELGKASVGRVRLMLNETHIWNTMVGGGHLMGTTRMSTDPTQGVVDANCKLHDIDNLFIAGSSVFASSGVTNPTLTIMALARRLGTHLKTELQ